MAGSSERNQQSFDQFDPQALAAILAELKNVTRAKLKRDTANPPANFVKVGPLDLSTAPDNPIKLPAPFKAIVLKTATDSTVQVKLILNNNSSGAVQMAYPLDANESISFEDPVADAYITWTAQSGKTATLYVAIDADIRSGKIINVTSGGVQISEGSGVTSLAGAQVTDTRSVLFAADTARIMMTIQNQSPISIFLGDTAVTASGGAKPGIEVVAGGTYEWKSSAACSAIAAAGGDTGALAISLTKWT